MHQSGLKSLRDIKLNREDRNQQNVLYTRLACETDLTGVTLHHRIRTFLTHKADFSYAHSQEINLKKILMPSFSSMHVKAAKRRQNGYSV